MLQYSNGTVISHRIDQIPDTPFPTLQIGSVITGPEGAYSPTRPRIAVQIICDRDHLRAITLRPGWVWNYTKIMPRPRPDGITDAPFTIKDCQKIWTSMLSYFLSVDTKEIRVYESFDEYLEAVKAGKE